MTNKILLFLVIVLAATTGPALLKLGRLKAAQARLESRLTAERLAALQKTPAPPPPAPASPTHPAPGASDRPATIAKLASLEAEVAELRRQAAEREAVPIAVASLVTSNRDDGRGRGRRFSDEDLAALKEADPARYEEIEKQRAEFRDRIKSAATDQVNFLESVDISRWSAEHQENHARLLANIAAFTEAMTQRTPSAEGEDGRRAMFERMRETGELMETEQSLLLYDTAQQMGFDEKGSKQFVEYIQTIQKATSPRGFFPGFGGHGGRGGGNGGDGGNTPSQGQDQPRQ
jgi:hypothetical protein